MDYEAFHEKFNIELNAQQEAAVRRTGGAALLLAVPGSGKTTVIVTRLGYMIYCCGIDPRSILTMTYTVAATNDMRGRFRQKFGDEFADRLEFRTINGVCDRVIRYYEQAKGRKAFRLVEKEKDLSAIIRGIWLDLGLEYPSESDIREARTLITYVKNMQLGDSEIKNLKLENAYFYSLYDAYRSYMRENRLMDYDDQLVYACLILQKNPDILAYFHSRYKYINVDEAQDTSKIQHAVIRLLASGSGNIFMVGDEDQSIYGFRAAYPQALLDFEKQWPGAEVLLMETNYRSTGNIIKNADRFIRKNSARRDKNMITPNSDGVPINHTVLNDYRDQYFHISQIAANNHGSTAVLYRNNDSSIPLIDLLNKYGISYRCRQMEGSFFTHYIVRDILDIIALAFDPADASCFERVYYKLNLGLPKVSMENAMVRHSKMPERPIIDVLAEDITLKSNVVRKLNVLAENFKAMLQESSYDAISRITKLMGYNDYLRSRHADTFRLDILLALALNNPVLKDFPSHLDALSEIIASGGDAGSDFVLSTIHSSKGLEYDKVIMLDVLDGLFPAIPEPEDDKSLKDEDRALLEEERRLFYVGVTRARKELEIVTYQNRYDLPALPVSSFITSLLPKKPREKSAVRAVPKPNFSGGKYDESIFQPGFQVEHKTFGTGTIVQRTGTIISIEFDGGGIRRFDLHACLQKKLLKPHSV